MCKDILVLAKPDAKPAAGKSASRKAAEVASGKLIYCRRFVWLVDLRCDICASLYSTILGVLVCVVNSYRWVTVTCVVYSFGWVIAEAVFECTLSLLYVWAIVACSFVASAKGSKVKKAKSDAKPAASKSDAKPAAKKASKSDAKKASKSDAKKASKSDAKKASKSANIDDDTEISKLLCKRMLARFTFRLLSPIHSVVFHKIGFVPLPARTCYLFVLSHIRKMARTPKL